MFQWLKKIFVPQEKNGYHPHFLRHTSISFFLLLIIIIEVGFFIQVFYVFDKTKFLAAVLPGVITDITNDERAAVGLGPLKQNDLLAQAAQLKAEDMAAKDYFAHTSPEGLTPWHWFQVVGYKYAHAGENLAVNFFDSADVADAWMDSPTHRANIVKANYTEIGVGIARGEYEGRSTIFVAQLFGTPITAAPVAVTPTPTSQPVVQPTPQPEPVIETTPEPEPVEEETVVLGEEENPAPVSAPTPAETKTIETSTPAPTPAPTPAQTPIQTAEVAIEKVLTAPRHGVNYAYTAIALMALVAIAMAYRITSELRHPGMVMRGAGLVAVIVVLSIINLRVLNIEPQVPSSAGGLEANAISAL